MCRHHQNLVPRWLYLVKFFRNLLLGENNELKNRYMLIGYKDDENDTHTSTHASSIDIQPSFENVTRLVLAIGKEEMSVTRIMEACQKRGVAAPTWSIYGGFVVVTFMRPAKGVTQDVTQGVTQGGTQGGTQGVPQGVPQDVPQGVPQDKELDDWIEKQIRNNPQISTEDLAKLSNRSSKTIKRHLAKMPHIRYVGSGYSGHWEVLDKE